MSCMTKEEIEALNMALEEIQQELMFLLEHFNLKLEIQDFIRLNNAFLSVMKAKIGETEG